MSSDFFINKSQAEKNGLQMVREESAQFPGYPYLREAVVQGKEIHISCGGGFRSFLTDWLDSNEIEYEVL